MVEHEPRFLYLAADAEALGIGAQIVTRLITADTKAADMMSELEAPISAFAAERVAGISQGVNRNAIRGSYNDFSVRQVVKSLAYEKLGLGEHQKANYYWQLAPQQERYDRIVGTEIGYQLSVHPALDTESYVTTHSFRRQIAKDWVLRRLHTEIDALTNTLVEDAHTAAVERVLHVDYASRIAAIMEADIAKDARQEAEKSISQRLKRLEANVAMTLDATADRLDKARTLKFLKRLGGTTLEQREAELYEESESALRTMLDTALNPDKVVFTSSYRFKAEKVYEALHDPDAKKYLKEQKRLAAAKLAHKIGVPNVRGMIADILKSNDFIEFMQQQTQSGFYDRRWARRESSSSQTQYQAESQPQSEQSETPQPAFKLPLYNPLEGFASDEPIDKVAAKETWDQISELHAVGKTQKQIYRELVKKWHPDTGDTLHQLHLGLLSRWYETQ